VKPRKSQVLASDGYRPQNTIRFGMIARQLRRRFAFGHRHRVADVDVAQRLDVADDVADLTGCKLVAADAPRRELPSSTFVCRAGLQESNPTLRTAPFITRSRSPRRGLVVAVKHHRLQRAAGSPWAEHRSNRRQQLRNSAGQPQRHTSAGRSPAVSISS
jgi:hypothetical protein